MFPSIEEITEEVENVLRQMTVGRLYREYSDAMVDVIAKTIHEDIYTYDDKETENACIDEELVVTAMMVALNKMCINNSNGMVEIVRGSR